MSNSKQRSIQISQSSVSNGATGVRIEQAQNVIVYAEAVDSNRGCLRIGGDVAPFGPDWFSGHVDAAILRAGPRYNPKLHYGHVLDETLAALGDTDAWRKCRDNWHSRLSQLRTKWRRAVTSKGGANSMSEQFPPDAAQAGEGLHSALEAVVVSLGEYRLENALVACQNAQELAGRIERELADDIDRRFGVGSADSTRFRQFQAEYQCIFPAQHLDDSREALQVLSELRSWLEAPAIRANTERVLLLTGSAGIGKTHGLCDAAGQRRDAGLPTILITGSQFSPDRSIWECFAAALALDSSLSRDVLLDALDAAGAVTGRLLICVDALDERARRTRWLDDLPELIQAVKRRPNLVLCLAVRDGYQKQVIRDDLDLPTFVHPGFSGMVFDACATFFNHFGLEPPIGPLLEPEFSNPLFLLVLCRTLQARKLTSVPAGWRGTKRMLMRLLAARDDELRNQVPGAGSRAVSAALHALAEALPEGGTLSWSEADRVVLQSLPLSQQGRLDLLDYLVGLGLLRVVPGEPADWTSEEDRVDIAFGRLRHHLLADRMTATGAASDERLRLAALEDPGLAESLALALPECGRGELVDLASSSHERRTLMQAWLASLPWRDGETLGSRVEDLVLAGLNDPDLEPAAFDALITLALRPGHAYDHHFLHAFLARCPMPRRDARLCLYLHEAFERTSPPSPIVRALHAPWESDPSRVERTLREAWCVVLGWCGAAADRRVRDHATKAAVRLTETDPGVWAPLVALFADVDDDAVLERVLCAAYGAVLRNPAPTALSSLAVTVRDRVLRRSVGTPQHALVRGHAQMIGEWAAYRGVLQTGTSIEDFRPPHDRPIDIQVPSEDELLKYEDQKNYPQIHNSVMSEWTGDFAKYTMPRVLDAYESLIDRDASRRWVLASVVALGYAPRLHAYYDHMMLTKHGPGRGKPVWAERIGKKYQLISLGRLAGILDDLSHAGGEETSGLACERLRDIDPSLLHRERNAEDEDNPASGACWWAPVAMDFAKTASLTDDAWVGVDDFPDPSALVSQLVDPARPNQRWRLLEGHFSWNNRDKKAERKQYRDAWMMVKGYLVPRRHLGACWRALATADFMGRWMVEGFDLEDGIYVGEYPWAPPFPEVRERSEAWQDEARRYSKFSFLPAANHLRRTGDSWQQDTIGITVPTAKLVEATATRWDGTSGFRKDDGSLIFQDPSVMAAGPKGLWVDEDALMQLQMSLDVGIVWTVLAERRIIGDWDDKNFCGMKHISMAMYLDGQQVQMRRCKGEHLLPDHTRRPA